MNNLRLRVLFGLFLVISGLLAYVLFWAPKTNVEWNRNNALIPTKKFPSLSGFDSVKLMSALDQSVKYYRSMPSDEPIYFGADSISSDRVVLSLENFRNFLASSPTSEALQKYIAENFILYRSAAETVLFTGYYVPVLKGSQKKTDKYQYPLYKTPPDLVSLDVSEEIKSKLTKDTPPVSKGRLFTSQDGKTKVSVPYLSREEIDGLDMLDGKNLELVWVENNLDRFFLHIQGSGKIQFEDGSSMRVGFAEKNGHPYRAIGKTLVERQLISPLLVNMFTIKETLVNNPTVVDEILYSNPSYVFFKELSGDVVGSLGTPLTETFSIATDSSIFPKGALTLYDTEFPVFDATGALKSWEPHVSFALNQDTGGAIRGPGRVDVFFGDSTEAERLAGYMQHIGNLFFLRPKE